MFQTNRCTKPLECRLYQRVIDENRRCLFCGRLEYLVSHFGKIHCHSSHAAKYVVDGVQRCLVLEPASELVMCLMTFLIKRLSGE